MKRLLPLWICCSFFLCCIGEDFVDDYVDPNLRITNAIIRIREGLSYQFQALFFDESGREVNNPTLECGLQFPLLLLKFNLMEP